MSLFHYWLRLDLFRLVLLALPVYLIYWAIKVGTPAGLLPLHVLVLMVVLAASFCWFGKEWLKEQQRTLGPSYLLFFACYVLFFALADHTDLISGHREPLASHEELRPRNTLGLAFLEDWHYLVAPRVAPAEIALIKVDLCGVDLSENRARLRQLFARIIRNVEQKGAKGIAFDFYFRDASAYDEKFASTIDDASIPVLLGFRFARGSGPGRDGKLAALPTVAQIAKVMKEERFGHLHAYEETDGRIRLIPAHMPRRGAPSSPQESGEWSLGTEPQKGLSVAMAEILGREPGIPRDGLIRFLPPSRQISEISLDFPSTPESNAWLSKTSFQDQLVLVGAEMPSERFDTPFGSVLGMELHAWAATNLVTGSSFESLRWSAAIIFGLCYALTLLHARGAGPALMLGAGFFLSALVMAVALWAAQNLLWLEVVYPLTGLWFLNGFLILLPRVSFRRPGQVPIKSLMSQEGRLERASDASVMLIHNSEDKPQVRILARELRSRDVEPWFDEEDVRPGESWYEAIQEIIKVIPAVAVIIGPTGLGPWGKKEVSASLKESIGRGIPVIPVLLPGAKLKLLPLFLTDYRYVDMRNGWSEEALDLLCWGISERPVRRLNGSTPRGS